MDTYCTKRYNSLAAKLEAKKSLSAPEREEWAVLCRMLDSDISQLKRLAPEPVADEGVITKTVWKRVDGKLTKVEEVDAAAMAARNMAKMAAHDTQEHRKAHIS